MLSSFEARSAAARAGDPSFRKPGSSLAAPPARAADHGKGGMAQPRAGTETRQTAAQRGNCDEAHGGSQEADETAAKGDKTKPEAEGKGAVAAVPRRGRWADSCPPCDRMAQDDNSDYEDEDACMDEGEDDADVGWGWGEQPTPEDLKSRWLQECRAVRALERAEWDCEETSAALLAARNARDRAEKKWKDARDPIPVSVRLGYAQKKFDKARRALDKCSGIMADFEEETERRRAELQLQIREAEGRLRQRQSQLDELHREAGDLAAGGPANRKGGGDEGEAERLVGVMARELQAFVESLDEGSEARGKANLLLARVATASTRAEHQSFDIATDAGKEESNDEQMGNQGTHLRRSSWGGSASSGSRRDPTWCENAQGRWNKSRQDNEVNKGESQRGAAAKVTSGGEAQGLATGGKPTEGAAAATTTTTSTTTNLSGREGSSDAGKAAGAEDHSRRGRETAKGREEGVEQPSNKSHRGHDLGEETSVEACGDDAARAAKLQKEQQAAIEAAQAANATFGDETSMHIAGQLYAHTHSGAAAGESTSSGHRPNARR